MKLGLLVIGYNKLKNVTNLLERLKECNYHGEVVQLIISLDYSGDNSIVNFAKAYEWPYGEKVVKSYEKRLGLKEHILRCGSYINEYELDAMAVFEDDIYPAIDFFGYMKQSVNKYFNEDRIAGISLYSYNVVPFNHKPFIPMKDSSDGYLINFAVSWGQVWMRKQWNDFYEWYKNNKQIDFNTLDINDDVKTWDNSWLKYHIAYCVLKEKFFFVPYTSFTTCMNNGGEHVALNSKSFQTNLSCENNKIYFFEDFNKIDVRYDCFFESIMLRDYYYRQGMDVCVNLYGMKSKTGKYELTNKNKNHKIIDSFGLEFKPHELNILYKRDGSDIFLYDTDIIQKNEFKNNELKKERYYYDGDFTLTRWIHSLTSKRKKYKNSHN